MKTGANRSLRLIIGSLVFISAMGMAKEAAAADTNAMIAPVPVSTQKSLLPELPWQKPVWLTDLSLAVKEGYDDNVFCAGANPANFPYYVVPAGSVAAVKDQGSWITTVTPKIGVNLAPVIGDDGFFKMLGLTYAPEIATYYDASSEDYQAHAITTTIAGKAGAFSVNLANTFTHVSGSSYGPTYPGAYLNAWATASFLKERREQNKDTGKISMPYDFDNWFIRPVASVIYFDMQTVLINSSGYQNYMSRNDLNGGLDVGCKLTPKLAATIGYRYGHQYQGQFSWNSYSSPNDYQRLLFGLEGKPVQWLTLQLQVGPDFRSYAPDTATHISPVYAHNSMVFYGEGSATAELSPQDSLTFSFRRFRWLSCLGQVPYDDAFYSLTYSRKLSDKLTFTLGGRSTEADFTCANISCGQRDDWMVSLTAGVNYAFNKNFSVSVNYSADLGINGLDTATLAVLSQVPSDREFLQNTISFSLQAKF